MEKNNYPLTHRRLRSNEHIRSLSATTRLAHQGFVQPIFVDEALQQKREVEGLPFVYVDTIDTVLETIAADIQAGISKFLLFPIPKTKSIPPFDFSFAVTLIQKIKQTFGRKIWLASDLCLCSYTTHGHCGILSDDQQHVKNEETVSILAEYALQLAEAGVDFIAPSDMMDGRIAAIRQKLDQNALDQVGIMSYAAKFSSQFYGPFRVACHSAPTSNILTNRKSYQMSPAALEDAISSALRDEAEGADILMVKPAANYTDVIRALSGSSSKPIAAYHVSGEYASIEALVQAGLANREAIHLEVWTALVRAGATIIISYAARNARSWIEKQEW